MPFSGRSKAREDLEGDPLTWLSIAAMNAVPVMESSTTKTIHIVLCVSSSGGLKKIQILKPGIYKEIFIICYTCITPFNERLFKSLDSCTRILVTEDTQT